MSGTGEQKIANLTRIANDLRIDLIDMFRASGKGHVGGSLSIVEIMTALYFHIMRVDPEKPRWPERDRLVLSKGHTAATWYAALAAKNFFPKDLLFTDYMKLGGKLQEHCDMSKVPGVDMSSGALGQGLSVGLGMSLAGRLAQKTYRVYVILGDGELQEGQVWEAFMAAGHYGADTLTAIIDYNKLQVCSSVARIMDLEPLAGKIEAFRWNVLEIDGNDMTQVVSALEQAQNNTTTRPTAVICHTVKGKGVSFIENNVHWHSHAFGEAEYREAKKELVRAEAQRGSR